jgi:hypothetical protein
MCVGPLAYTSGLGFASQAVKKGGPLALVSPVAAMLTGGASKSKPAAPAPAYGG